MIKTLAAVGRFLDRIPAKWQFAAFVGVTIVITVALTLLSYSLYVVSGTAQLDLSRPGYKQALSEVAPSQPDEYTFASTGALDSSALKEFKQKYDALNNKTRVYGAFDSSALSDDQLNLTGAGVVGPQ